MITSIFTIIAIINALLLLSLFGVIYLKANTQSEAKSLQYEKYQDILLLALLIGVVTAVGLSALIIL